MKVRLHLIFILIFLPLLGLSQSSFGIRMFGPQGSNFSDMIGAYKTTTQPYNQGIFLGILTGASFKINLQGRHYLFTELLYSMRGESYYYNTSTLNGATVSSTLNYFLDYRAHYIEIPAMYCYDLSRDPDSRVHFYVSSGFSAGINVISKMVQNYFTADTPGYVSLVNEHRTETNISSANPLILNFVADVEAEFRRQRKTKYFVYGRFNRSLSNVYNHSANMNTKVLTYGIGFGMRWYLN